MLVHETKYWLNPIMSRISLLLPEAKAKAGLRCNNKDTVKQKICTEENIRDFHVLLAICEHFLADSCHL